MGNLRLGAMAVVTVVAVRFGQMRERAALLHVARLVGPTSGTQPCRRMLGVLRVLTDFSLA